MEISPVLPAPSSAPTEAKPSSADGSAPPGDGFGAALSAAMDKPKVDPSQQADATPPVASTQPTLVAAVPATFEPEAKPVFVAAADQSVALLPELRKPLSPGREAKVEAPPDPPPLSPAPQPIVDKEAPTTAPNAPVDPLDPILDQDETSFDSVPAVATFTMVAPIVVAPLENAVARVVETKADAGSVAPVETASISSLGQDDTDAVPRQAHAPKLEAAPDLGIVPRVSSDVVGSTPTPNPVSSLVASSPVADQVPVPVVQTPSMSQTTAIANVEVAKVASRVVESSDAPAQPVAVRPSAGAKSMPLSAASEPVASLVAEETSGDAGEAPSDDAPQGAFTETPVFAAKTAVDRPDEGLDRPTVDRHLVVRQVADRIESMVASRPKDGVTIHLEPRDLGTVTLVVKGLSSALDVRVSASDERVQRSLESSRPELAQSLAPKGIELRELRIAPPTVTSASGTSSSGSDAGSSPNPQGRARPQNPAPSSLRSSRSEASSPRASRQKGRGVDLLV